MRQLNGRVNRFEVNAPPFAGNQFNEVVANVAQLHCTDLRRLVSLSTHNTETRFPSCGPGWSRGRRSEPRRCRPAAAAPPPGRRASWSPAPRPAGQRRPAASAAGTRCRSRPRRWRAAAALKPGGCQACRWRTQAAVDSLPTGRCCRAPER